MISTRDWINVQVSFIVNQYLALNVSISGVHSDSHRVVKPSLEEKGKAGLPNINKKGGGDSPYYTPLVTIFHFGARLLKLLDRCFK